jgi:hypothetical protein
MRFGWFTGRQTDLGEAGSWSAGRAEMPTDAWMAGAFAAILALSACGTQQTPSATVATPPSSLPYASAADQICRGYANAEQGEAGGLMYDQCMYARGYLVPGFSPSPGSPGYQGPLLGPAAIGGH